MSNNFELTYDDYVYMSGSLLIATDDLINDLQSVDLSIDDKEDFSVMLTNVNLVTPKIQSYIDNINLNIKEIEYNLYSNDLEAICYAVSININIVENQIYNEVHEKQRNKLRKDLKSLKNILKKCSFVT